jgi:tRNA(Ile2) C34 agmatinyltransferase TiaS
MHRTLAVIAISLVVIALVAAVFWWWRDPRCATCGARAWSKGVPPWRCRQCGHLQWPDGKTSPHQAQHQPPSSKEID